MTSYGEAANWVAVMLSPDALIRSISPNSEKITGYPVGDLVGRPITQILTDRSLFEVPQMLRISRETGIWEGSLTHRDRSGNAIPSRACLSSLHGPCETDGGYLLLSAPATPAPGAEGGAILEEVALKLRNITHELNNPLAIVMGFTQLILLNGQCEGKMRMDVERLYSEMRRLIQVVEKLHAYAVSLQDRAETSHIGRAS